MNFKELLIRAKAREPQAMEAILNLYTPLLLKESILDGVFDEEIVFDVPRSLPLHRDGI